MSCAALLNLHASRDFRAGSETSCNQLPPARGDKMSDDAKFILGIG
jgi:hypothetical protein